MSQTVQLIVQGRVATLTINRPPVNALDTETLRAISGALKTVEKDENIGAVVIRSGIEKGFSAGVDIKEHADPGKVYNLLNEFERAVRTILASPKPVVAAVKGFCMGGGMELVTVCDLVVAGRDASFGQPEITLAHYPPLAAALLPLVIGLRNTYKLLLTGETISADEAHRLGLVTHLVDDEDVEKKASQLASSLSERSGAAIALAKRALAATIGAERLLDTAFSHYYQELLATEDNWEGLKAFLEKRSPVWKHR
uniref:Enoyl-CoA hydratase n=2 Tax=Thermoproteati TaxID=1783275 RepID=E6NAL9_CALS0|nr:enoyl-CoA hydratase [Candidatus Caldarchaeum subterraneum]BAL57031.1 dienoyl-CoA hydratase [uncultured crenarchaeote]